MLANIPSKIWDILCKIVAVDNQHLPPNQTRMKVQAILVILLCLIFQLNAQDKAKIKFGKLSTDDFKSSYNIDPTAEAVIIGDIGSSDFIGNSKGSFSIEFKRYKRVHILNKNAYDVAKLEIPIYTTGGREEELVTLKAVTYNLENGKIVETKLDTKSGVIKERINRNWVVHKFTFPAVREGSIIEVEYKLRSEYLFRLRPWQFQDKYPTLWSEYLVGMPEFLSYVSLTQGYQQYHIKESKSKRESFSVDIPKEGVMHTAMSDRVNFSAGLTTFRWVMKDLPALKEESYTSTISNHVSKIEFQLSEYREPFIPKKVMNTWAETATVLMADEDFGLPLQEPQAWLTDGMPSILKTATTPLDKAKNIYTWLRDNMTCTGRNTLYLKKSLQSTFKSRTGTVAEINLLLIAMLRAANLQADPVILSTRANGYAYDLYPLIDRFNYVVACVIINGEKYYLDASRPLLGFNKLGADCYNGHARVINAAADGLELTADSLQEKSITSVFIVNDDKGRLSTNIQHIPGYYESYVVRSDVKEKGLSSYFKELVRAEADVQITENKIDALDRLEDPVSIKYSSLVPAPEADIYYFEPISFRAWKENPFKSAERLYPVEMPYKIDQTYLLRMDVPVGYTVDELPKSLIVKLNNHNAGEFEFRAVESGGIISIRSRLKINRTYFAPEEYQMLRDFFDLVVKKQSEQIVFKK